MIALESLKGFYIHVNYEFFLLGVQLISCHWPGQSQRSSIVWPSKGWLTKRKVHCTYFDPDGNRYFSRHKLSHFLFFNSFGRIDQRLLFDAETNNFRGITRLAQPFFVFRKNFASAETEICIRLGNNLNSEEFILFFCAYHSLRI